ncbi:MAG TPA: GEVED domain-containing protein [Faecalibacter sp.]
MKKNLLLLSLLSLPAFGFGQVVLNETFDNGIPSSWSIQQTNANESWESYDLQGNIVASVSYDANLEQQDEWMITPTIDLSNVTGAYFLTFDASLSYSWSISPQNTYDVFVKVSTDNGATWSQLWTESDLGTFGDYEITPVRIDLSEYMGQSNVKIAFQYVGLDGAQAIIDNVKVEGFEVAPTVPNCSALISPANGATGVEFSPSIQLVWEAPTSGDAPTAYEVHFGINPTQLNLLGATPNTAVGITAASADTTYYWSIVPKNEVGAATGCEVYSFTTTTGPFSPYCGDLNFSNAVEPITNVSFAGINNRTATQSTVSHEIFLDQAADVTPGMTYTMSLEGNTDGDFTNRFFVFIDWDQNGVFDENELYMPSTTLVNSTGNDGKTVTLDITVPENAVQGTTRLRIKKTFNTTEYSNPCLAESSYGQAEDYSVNVGTLSTVDTTKSSIKVYPNPVVDYLVVDSFSEAISISVIDITGRQVLSQNASSKVNRVNMSSLSAGTYIVTVESNDGVQSFKVIKK